MLRVAHDLRETCALSIFVLVIASMISGWQTIMDPNELPMYLAQAR